MSYPRVLVSILNYNKIADTIETVRCFEKQTYPNFEIQIIDNASTKEIVSKLREQLPNTRIISLEQNIGYTGGNNMALEIGLNESFDYVIISNNDILIENDLIANLVETAQKKPLSGIVGVIEEDYGTGEIRTIGGRGFDFIRATVKWINSIPPTSEKAIEMDYVQGALVLFTERALLSKVRLDDNLFMFYDEVGLYFKLKEKGLKAYVDLRNHLRHKSIRKTLNPLTGYYFQRNRIYLSRRYAPCYVFLLTVLYMALFELPIKVFVRSIQGNAYYTLACVIGFLDGLRGQMSVSKRGFKC